MNEGLIQLWAHPQEKCLRLRVQWSVWVALMVSVAPLRWYNAGRYAHIPYNESNGGPRGTHPSNGIDYSHNPNKVPWVGVGKMQIPPVALLGSHFQARGHPMPYPNSPFLFPNYHYGEGGPDCQNGVVLSPKKLLEEASLSVLVHMSGQEVQEPRWEGESLFHKLCPHLR